MNKYFQNHEDLWKLYYLDTEYNKNLGEDVQSVIIEPKLSSFLIDSGFSPVYPENKSFAICLTHDVDEIYTPIIHRVHSLVSTVTSANLNNLSDAFRGILDKKKSRYHDFTTIMDLEDDYNSKSTFFFLATKKDPIRFRYDIEDIYNELGEIKDRGYEVGLHGGFFSYNDFRILREEKNRLEKVLSSSIKGYRSHYLNLHNPHTWQFLSELGFSYDSTLGYRKGSGFRNGMCHPFHPYIKENNTMLNLLEIPLIIMDAAYPTLFFNMNKYWNEISRLIDFVEKNKGVLTINWHNDSLLSTRKKEQGKLYKKILEEGKKRNAWLSNCYEVNKWWRKNLEQFESTIFTNNLNNDK